MCWWRTQYALADNIMLLVRCRRIAFVLINHGRFGGMFEPDLKLSFPCRAPLGSEGNWLYVTIFPEKSAFRLLLNSKQHFIREMNEYSKLLINSDNWLNTKLRWHVSDRVSYIFKMSVLFRTSHINHIGGPANLLVLSLLKRRGIQPREIGTPMVFRITHQ